MRNGVRRQNVGGGAGVLYRCVGVDYVAHRDAEFVGRELRVTAGGCSARLRLVLPKCKRACRYWLCVLDIDVF